jgi:hypothetical protein
MSENICSNNLLEENISILPHNFDWIFYIKINKDLIGHCNTKNDAEIHYLNHGCFENRIYCKENIIPKDFDWKYYVNNNEDLKYLKTKEDAEKHYINHGHLENRKYCDNISQLIHFFNNPNIFNEDTNIFLLYNNYLKYIRNIVNANKKYTLNDFEDLNKKINIIEKTITIYNAYYHDYNENIDNYYIENNNINYFKPNYKIISIDENFLNIYDSFILVVDSSEKIIDNSKKFLNSIINKYSKYTIFLILRVNIDNNIQININNKYYLKNTYNDCGINNFIEKNIVKIKKIFVNSFGSFSNRFISFIQNLTIEKIGMIHDHTFCVNTNYYNIFYNNNKELLFDEIFEINKINKFKNFDYVICENIKNTYLFHNIKNELPKLIISSMPDYNESDQIVYTDNIYTNIIVIGEITKTQGSEILEFLIYYYKDTDIKIFIIGSIERNNYEYNNIFQYENIDDFNNLLLKIKPNLILELSIIPEIYSYTLTCAILTKLPILSLKKAYDNSIEYRMKDYKNVFYFTNIKELNKLIKENKQCYFYTIKQYIYYNYFWETYFNYYKSSFFFQKKILSYKDDEFENLYMYKNIVLITSKIYVKTSKFSYSETRSIYSTEERFKQTIETIQSIRNKISNSYIVLFDNSEFTEKEHKLLNKTVDYFINIIDNNILNYYTNFCEYKYLSELTQQIYSYSYFFKYMNFNKIGNFFKISGRYLINNKFNYNNYNNDNNIFALNNNIKDREYYYTCFYKISNKFLKTYFKNLIGVFFQKEKYFNYDLEVIFGIVFKKNMTLLNELGITQRISCWNEISDI